MTFQHPPRDAHAFLWEASIAPSLSPLIADYSRSLCTPLPRFRLSAIAVVQVSFALVGGLAVSARAEPRFTRDADLAVALASDAEAEALIHSLRARDCSIEAVVEQDTVGRLATVRLTRSREPRGPVIDLRSSGIMMLHAQVRTSVRVHPEVASSQRVEIGVPNGDNTGVDARDSRRRDSGVDSIERRGAGLRTSALPGRI
jgi:hypothetical protein